MTISTVTPAFHPAVLPELHMYANVAKVIPRGKYSSSLAHGNSSGAHAAGFWTVDMVEALECYGQCFMPPWQHAL